MTRKDYILIARALKEACEVDATVDEAAMFIATELEDDNPRFSRSHFLAVVRGEKALESRPARKVRIAESAASESEKVLARTGGNVEIAPD